MQQTVNMIDFAGLNFTQVNFSNVNFSELNFTRINFYQIRSCGGWILLAEFCKN